ncbi:hypothetical protein [Sphaerospermopsis torques-reginae]|jgi:hypothetical protein|nr:hypothetical protein [Sphaerospermopsis torques-reginae]
MLYSRWERFDLLKFSDFQGVGVQDILKKDINKEMMMTINWEDI